MTKTILVLGGTGVLGQPVSRGLKEDGFDVRILTRDCQKASELFDGSSYHLVGGNPLDEACLDSALQHCYGVHISLPGEAELEAAKLVARLAPAHGIARITYISGATVAEETRWFPMIDRKAQAEAAIQASGIPFTILCPTWIMESLPMFVMHGRAAILGKQPAPYHWVAARDLAQIVVAAYRQEAGERNRIIVLGPEAIQMKEALSRYCAVFHPEIVRVSAMPFWLANLIAALTRAQGLKAASEMMAYFEKVGEGDARPAPAGILGMPAMTLDQWLGKRRLDCA